jgi:acetolactate synthase I/II/III large subunit
MRAQASCQAASAERERAVPAEQRTGGQLIVKALEEAGVRHCFGVPGESFLGVLDALYDSSIKVVSTRHEGGGSFMAVGYAKTSGEIGVCFGTRAVGTANMAIGVHNGRQDSVPMIALAGQVNRSFIGREAFQEVDLVAAMKPLAKWATQIPAADRVPEVMAKAISMATSGRPGPVFLSVPQDVCDELSDSVPRATTTITAAYPDPGALSALLDALLTARRPLIFAGGGLYNSPQALGLLVRFAERTQIPVITSWRHHDEFPNDHPLFLGCASLGTPPTVWERLGESDVMLVIGNRMQETSTNGYVYPLTSARLFQVDVDPAAFVNHRSPDLAVLADAGVTLSALIDRLPDPVPLRDERHDRNVADRRRFENATVIPEAAAAGDGVSYAHVMRVLTTTLSPDTVISSDAGNFYGWLARYYRFRKERTYLGPASGAMGFGLPAAIGAKIARPDTPVVSISGDGGFLMTAAELETAVRYGVGVVAIVLDNARQGTIRMHQEALYPGRVIATELGTTDLAVLARGLGVDGYLVQDSSMFEPTLRAALNSGGPSVIQVRMDRDQLSVQKRLTSPSATAKPEPDIASELIANF